MSRPSQPTLKELNREIQLLSEKLDLFEEVSSYSTSAKRKFVQESGNLILSLTKSRERLSPVKFGSIDVTLGNPKSIAKFFTFNFITCPREPLSEVVAERFYGAGVYAIYYEGNGEMAYRLIHPFPIWTPCASDYHLVDAISVFEAGEVRVCGQECPRSGL